MAQSQIQSLFDGPNPNGFLLLLATLAGSLLLIIAGCVEPMGVEEYDFVGSSSFADSTESDSTDSTDTSRPETDFADSTDSTETGSEPPFTEIVDACCWCKSQIPHCQTISEITAVKCAELSGVWHECLMVGDTLICEHTCS